jgi:hypothetical protein
VNGNILNSKGVQVAVVTGREVFSLKGQKLYDLRGVNILQVERRPRRSFVRCERYRETSGQSHRPAVSSLLICEIAKPSLAPFARPACSPTRVAVV